MPEQVDIYLFERPVIDPRLMTTCPVCGKQIGKIWYALHVFQLHQRDRVQHTGRFL